IARDAAATDASAPTSDAAEASDVVADGARAFCTGHVEAAFCDDFDSPSAIAWKAWSTTFVTAGGRVDLVDGLSPPHAFGSYAEIGAATTAAARLWADLSVGARRASIAVAFALYIDDVGPSVETNV